MLVNMSEALKVAQENKFGIPAFNIGNVGMLNAVMAECEEQESPVILAVHPDELACFGDEFAKMIVQVAKSSKIPAVVHLDHGGSIQDVMRAVRDGFSSVMIDASHETFEKNIEISKKVVELCHPLNISVEGELGTIGNNDGTFEGTKSNIIYTSPSDVEEYIKQTNVDTLAIAIGTAHGLYPKDMQPELRIDILQEVRKITDKYLVLHGGSGNKDSEIQRAVENGIQKVNISSDYKSVFYKEYRRLLNENPGFMEPNQLLPGSIKEARKVIKNKLELLGTVNKAKLYY